MAQFDVEACTGRSEEATGSKDQVVGVAQLLLAADAGDGAPGTAFVVTHALSGVDAYTIGTTRRTGEDAATARAGSPKCTKSWPLPPGKGQTLTAQAVQHVGAGVLLAVLADSTLIAWQPATAQSLNSARTKKFPSKIAVVLPLADSKVGTLLVMGNTSVTWCNVNDFTSKPLLKPLTTGSIKNVWACTTTYQQQPAVMILACTAKSVIASLHVVTPSATAKEATMETDDNASAKEQPPQLVELTTFDIPLQKSVTVSSWAYDATQSQLALLWTNGTIDVYRVSDDNGATRTASLPLREDTASNEAAGTAICWVSSDTIFAAASAATPEKQDVSEIEVTVVDTKYGSLQGSTRFQAPSPTSRVVTAVPLHGGDAVAVAVGGSVRVVSVYCPAITLAAALVRPSVAEGRVVEPPLSVTPYLGEFCETLKVSEPEFSEDGSRSLAVEEQEQYWAEHIKPLNDKEEKFLASIDSPALTPKQFGKLFAEYTRQRAEERKAVRALAVAQMVSDKSLSVVMRSESTTLDGYTAMSEALREHQEAVAEITRFYDEVPNLSHNFVRAVCRKCLSTSEKLDEWWSPMKYFLNENLLRYDMVPALLSTLTHQRLLGPLELCVRKLRGIPEHELVRLLVYYDSADERALLKHYTSQTKLVALKRKQSNATSKPQKKKLAAYMDVPAESAEDKDASAQHATVLVKGSQIRGFMRDLVVALPCSHLLTFQALKRVPTTQIISLLRYLVSRMKAHAHGRPRSCSTPLPTSQQVFGWFEAVLDSHVAELTVLHETSLLLEAAREAANALMATSRRARPLEPLLLQLLQWDLDNKKYKEKDLQRVVALRQMGDGRAAAAVAAAAAAAVASPTAAVMKSRSDFDPYRLELLRW
eukprot:TRINITY_DN214_c0_g1_i12.p1 TRINITY_DN214_c0_g1~~TRINITY_DN214_c0_g1_i12.p1  ORF type:complete len:892 (+),score=224.11 TRINITY_DN214_c0_g1_i12:51-2678(+)